MAKNASPNVPENHDVAELLGQATSSTAGGTGKIGETAHTGGTDTGGIDTAMVRRLVRVLRRSVRISRKGFTLGGQGMADLLLAVAPHLRIRNLDALQAHYGGLSGPALAGHVIRSAARHSAAVGGLTGVMASAGELAPPLWFTLPVELVAETLLVASIEMKLVAELHEVYGCPITGSISERAVLIMQSWSERRAIVHERPPSEQSATGADTNKRKLRQSARREVTQAVRRRLMVRLARNVSSLAPLLVGAVAGAEVNRRATRDLGDTIVGDLSLSL